MTDGAPSDPAPDLSTASFRCCDTVWTIGASSAKAVRRGQETALRLEAILNAFDPASAVSRLNATGQVDDPVVAAVVRGALQVRDLTGGAFDIRHGRLEHAIKAHLRGGPRPTGQRPAARVEVDGDSVRTDGPLDLNGIAKGAMADLVLAAMLPDGPAFVDAGGDIAHPLWDVDVESPRGGILATLATTWNVATSGNDRRRRGDVDHIYDPRDGHVGARHDQVTVLCEQGCARADALATTFAAMAPGEAHRLAERLPGVEALFLKGGKVWWTTGLEAHARAV